MKKSMAWHRTRLGGVALWLGSIELAVPVLVLTAAALAVGTYLDSARNTRIARELVYGSWWFAALMGLVCVSLVFSVISRFPWKRRHIGFITVHAGLVALIAGGFWSMFGRVEGHLALQEGESGAVIETQDEQIELGERRGGEDELLVSLPAPSRPTSLTLAGVHLQVVERWENSRDEQVVTNDAPGPFRAVQIKFGSETSWAGQEDKAGGPLMLGPLAVRVLPDGAELSPAGAAGESLVVHGPCAAPRFTYVAADGTSRELTGPATFPRSFDLGMRRIVVMQQLDRARGSWRTVSAPEAKDNRPALLLRLAESTEIAAVPFKQAIPLSINGRELFVRFGPRQVRLPFEVRLGEFKKTDYPGTEMAMAYESYVGITNPGRDETGYRIFMNHPYVQGPWKVYQSGYVGENISVFSVMRDPGLMLTYIGSAALCLGILVTFYSRSMSWGHPGIPVAFTDKERVHVPASNDPEPRAALAGRPVGAGV